MNTRRRLSNAFTLIELLTVLVIIMILVGILVPTVKTVKTKAKETTARTQVASLRTAITQFYSTYGHLPNPDGASTDQTVADYTELINILTGNEADAKSPKENPRGIVFLDQSQSGGFVDPWQNSFSVAMDYDYSGEITTGPFETVNSSVAVWSWGKDETDDNGNDDDLNSWGG